MGVDNSLTFVKLGGSLLTDKRGEEVLRPEILDRLAGELAEASAEMPGRLILGHGSGSFGHVAAARYAVHEGLADPERLPGVSLTQDRAATLHRHLVTALLDHHALPFSLPPSAFAVAASRRPVEMWLESFERALAVGLLPVTYGDVVLDRDQGAAILSTEAVFEFLIGRIVASGRSVERVLWLGETAGVYDSSGETIEVLSPTTLDDMLRHVSGASGTDVTGGIRLRLETMRRLVALGVSSVVLDGRVPGRLTDALRGSDVPGTRIVAG